MPLRNDPSQKKMYINTSERNIASTLRNILMAARKDLRYLATEKNQYYKYVHTCTGCPITYRQWLKTKK